jgi:hypothetical protein
MSKLACAQRLTTHIVYFGSSVRIINNPLQKTKGAENDILLVHYKILLFLL